MLITPNHTILVLTLNFTSIPPFWNTPPHFELNKLSAQLKSPLLGDALQDGVSTVLCAVTALLSLPLEGKLCAQPILVHPRPRGVCAKPELLTK